TGNRKTSDAAQLPRDAIAPDRSAADRETSAGRDALRTCSSGPRTAREACSRRSRNPPWHASRWPRRADRGASLRRTPFRDSAVAEDRRIPRRGPPVRDPLRHALSPLRPDSAKANTMSRSARSPWFHVPPETGLAPRREFVDRSCGGLFLRLERATASRAGRRDLHSIDGAPR